LEPFTFKISGFYPLVISLPACLESCHENICKSSCPETMRHSREQHMSLTSVAVWNICLPCVSIFTLLLHPTLTSLSRSSTGAETGEVNKQFAQHLCKMCYYRYLCSQSQAQWNLACNYLAVDNSAILHACFLNN